MCINNCKSKDQQDAWKTFCYEWVFVPWWLAWFAWSLVIGILLLSVVIIATPLLSLDEWTGTLIWLFSSVILGALGASVTRWLYRRHCPHSVWS